MEWGRSLPFVISNVESHISNYAPDSRLRWRAADSNGYARRMGQPTQRATNCTARSNIDTAQIFLHANDQRPNRAMIR